MNAIPTYAIVGAGFSGMAVAVQLLQRLGKPARICLINRSLGFGRGMAYGTNSPSHLLNVPAGRMSIDHGNPSGFVHYLQSRGLSYAASDFVPRSLYGDYLERCLLKAQASAAQGVRLEVIESEVLRLQMRTSGQGPVLTLGDGAVLEATEVVLALGNFTPQPPWTERKIDWNTRPLYNDVWTPGIFDTLAPDASVLLVGTGLTAYDAVLRLLDRGHKGPITMLSRRGLLPQPHREQDTAPGAGLVSSDFLVGETKMRNALRVTRRLIANAAGSGHDWRDVIGGLRHITPRLWKQMDAKSKKQFVRHVAPYWDTHRHRAAPTIYRRIHEALAAGQLQVVQGRLIDITTDAAAHARVTWRLRGETAHEGATFAAVVNCTGPSSDLRRVSDPLITQLMEARQLHPDALSLGLRVSGDYHLLQADGWPMKNVRYVGPLLKAELWEATAVPELREHARKLADCMLTGTQADATL
jgi:uncharacterized NAD(P)/FAD-binding protein YdhS